MEAFKDTLRHYGYYDALLELVTCFTFYHLFHFLYKSSSPLDFKVWPIRIRGRCQIRTIISGCIRVMSLAWIHITSVGVFPIRISVRFIFWIIMVFVILHCIWVIVSVTMQFVISFSMMLRVYFRFVGCSGPRLSSFSCETITESAPDIITVNYSM